MEGRFVYRAVHRLTISGSYLRPLRKQNELCWLIYFITDFPEFTEVSPYNANYEFGYFVLRGLSQSPMGFIYVSSRMECRKGYF
jgi:hypothetical protein